MEELHRILQLWAEAESSGASAVLATVVKTRGSSYRLPGARLLLTSTGKRAGAVSGGCLEDDLIKKAWWFTENGPIIRRYDTTPEGEIAAEYGLGCNGIIHVLLERLTAGNAACLDVIRTARAERRPAVIAHLIQPAEAAGQRLIIGTRGDITHNLASSELVNALKQYATIAVSDRASREVSLSETAEAFIEVVTPAPHLFVFGAGDDAVPVTEMAKYLGWKVSVIDGRAHYARREKFPHADQVLVRPAGKSGVISEVDPWTAAVLMTHSYSQDLEALRELAAAPLFYLGILGPRKRTSQLLAEADLDASKLGPTLHSPMGLDIGADGPQQVALAVIAEIQATLNGRNGGLLRDRSGSIHARNEDLADPEGSWARSIACA